MRSRPVEKDSESLAYAKAGGSRATILLSLQRDGIMPHYHVLWVTRNAGWAELVKILGLV